jgi:uncharacterized protein YndB with AHSA1/START domain
MTITTCPTAIVEAPVDRVWQLLADPHNYALWWDAETYAIEPVGRAEVGQRVLARTRALGKDWELRVTIAGVDPDQRIVDLTTQLPFGVTVHNHIVCRSLDSTRCRVSFG